MRPHGSTWVHTAATTADKDGKSETINHPPTDWPSENLKVFLTNLNTGVGAADDIPSKKWSPRKKLVFKKFTHHQATRLHASALFWSIELFYTLVCQSIHRLVDLVQRDKRLHHPHIMFSSSKSAIKTISNSHRTLKHILKKPPPHPLEVKVNLLNPSQTIATNATIIWHNISMSLFCFPTLTFYENTFCSARRQHEFKLWSRCKYKNLSKYCWKHMDGIIKFNGYNTAEEEK